MDTGNSLLQSIGSAVSAALQSPDFQNPRIQPRYPHGTGGTGVMGYRSQVPEVPSLGVVPLREIREDARVKELVGYCPDGENAATGAGVRKCR